MCGQENWEPYAFHNDSFPPSALKTITSELPSDGKIALKACEKLTPKLLGQLQNVCIILYSMYSRLLVNLTASPAEHTARNPHRNPVDLVYLDQSLPRILDRPGGPAHTSTNTYALAPPTSCPETGYHNPGTVLAILAASTFH